MACYAFLCSPARSGALLQDTDSSHRAIALLAHFSATRLLREKGLVSSYKGSQLFGKLRVSQSGCPHCLQPQQGSSPLRSAPGSTLGAGLLFCCQLVGGLQRPSKL